MIGIVGRVIGEPVVRATLHYVGMSRVASGGAVASNVLISAYRHVSGCAVGDYAIIAGASAKSRCDSVESAILYRPANVIEIDLLLKNGPPYNSCLARV